MVFEGFLQSGPRVWAVSIFLITRYQHARSALKPNPDQSAVLLFPALFQQPFLFPIRLRRGLFSRFGTDAQDKVGRWLTGLAITRS